MPSCSISFLILCALIGCLAFPSITSPGVSSNTKYTYTGKSSINIGRCSIDTTSVYGTGYANWSPEVISIPYHTVYNSSILAFANIDQLSIDTTNQRINISIQVSYAGYSSMNVSIYSNLANKISLLSVRYYVATNVYS